MPYTSSPNGFLPNETNPQKLLFYPKLVALYDITFYFTNTYLEPKDRTRDQMLQAARSGKQNIIEGAADGLTSTKMELSLTNCAKGSLRELQADYEDYLRARDINIWSKDHPRTARLNAFCKSLTAPEKHVNTWKKMNDEELANLSLTLIHQSTYLIEHYLRMLEQRFITQGGISEAMTRARQNHRHF
ncbi:MAG: four helix bundle suffix domain-containing protein [Prevotella sp.]|nr:four helix bundle suffix domain-containing protein [Prevotella sp.]